MKIGVNQSRVSRLDKIEFGVCQIIDGLVGLLSLGYLCTDLPITSAKRAVRRSLKKELE